MPRPLVELLGSSGRRGFVAFMTIRGTELVKSLTERFAEVQSAAKTGGAYFKLFTFEPNEKIVDDEKRTVTFTITTGSIDRDNDVITPSGWDVSEYLKNPVVLWAHDYSQLPVARAISVEPTPNGLKSTAQFPPKGLHDFADKVFELIKLGFLNASSVGFKPQEYSRDEERGGLNFLRQSMLEWSIVPVPANSEALAVATAKGVDVAPLLKWARKTIADFEAVAKKKCETCGEDYEGAGAVCEGCAAPKGVTYGDGTNFLIKAVQAGKPVTLQVVERAAALNRIGSEPARAKEGYSIYVPDEDPIRWNRTLSKAFDVEGEPVEPAKLEIHLVSRFLDAKVQYLTSTGFEVPSARMGSFLAATDERLSEWKIEATRNITESGREAPPNFETIQLNSTTSRSFLIEGLRFLRRNDGAKMVVKFRPNWCGLAVTCYVKTETVDVAHKFVDGVMSRAVELNFLRGEAFTLSGEFIDRGDLDWAQAFYEPHEEKILRKTVDRLNEQGEDMESRGLMLMGPPGTGKTLAGRVMLRQADTTFIWVSARDFFRAGAFGAFTYAFDLAAECAPSIIFFEDVDNWLGSSHVDLLKTEMDGLKRSKGVQTILTTNFPELIPDALIDRPGRFHDVLELALPTEAVRLRMLASWMPSAAEPDRVLVARETEGFSGAHIRHLTKFAATIEADDKLSLGDALKQALTKVKEQRELIASLKNGEHDYRPRRVVRSLVAESIDRVSKRGRILSASNEGKIRTAAEAIVQAGEKLSDVLSQVAAQEEVPDPAPVPEVDGGVKDLAIRLLPDSPDDGTRIAVKIVDEKLSKDDAMTALKDAVSSALAEEIREQITGALAKARGRVD